MKVGLQPIALGVFLEREAAPEEVAAVEQVFRERQIDARVEARLMRKSAALMPWALWIVVPAAAIFLNGFVNEAGADAYLQLKALVKRLYDARGGSQAPKGTILLFDELTSHEYVVLPDDLPDKAWQALLTIEIRETKSGTLRWDSKAEQWRDTWEMTE